MIRRIKDFFNTQMLLQSTQADDTEHRLNLACAALLVEMIHVDHHADQKEDEKLTSILKIKFKLDNEEIQELIELAHEEKHQAIDYYRFTSLINEHYTQEQKIDLVKNLWEIAFADNQLDKFEEHLVRKLAELLHVPHSAFIQAKHSVIDKN